MRSAEGGGSGGGCEGFGHALQASEYFLEGAVGAVRVRTVRA